VSFIAFLLAGSREHSVRRARAHGIRAGPPRAAENHARAVGAASDAVAPRRADDRRERRHTMFETIAWATDGSELADGALEHVRELARLHGSGIVAVHANEVLTGRFGGAPLLADEPEIRHKIEAQVAELRTAGFDAKLEVLSGGDDVATLIERAAAEAGADLVVVGTHGRSGVTAALLGSVARALCRTSRRPVLVVPPADRAERAADDAPQLTTA
jgi:nucleotide-binding universal stress UspA family protein